MKLVWMILFLLAAGLSQDEGSVEVYRVEKAEILEVYARNSNIYPVTIEVDMTLKNLQPNRKLPLTTFLAPNSDQRIMELLYKDKKAGWDYRTQYRYYMGSIFAQHDDSFAYRLPYPIGKSFKIDQGFGGAFSHLGEMKYALDINMPTGTPVYAARGGKVVMFEEGNDRGGPTEDMMQLANYITILHDDGTFADYSHLKYQGVKVKLGQKVRMGQLIGYSGATGFATGPHLHFDVKKAKRGGGFMSLPVRFATKDGIKFLEEGHRYVGY